MTNFRLLVVPYEVGAARMGVGRGPERLLEAGAEEALGSSGARVGLDVIELSMGRSPRATSAGYCPLPPARPAARCAALA